jgi:hypothetical protein
MKVISVKDMVDFKRRSDRRKKTFVINMKKTLETSSSNDGIDYWTSGVSAIISSFKKDSLQPLFDRKSELIKRYDSAIHKTSKIMYMQNIEIINTYSELNKENWRPTQKIKFESISSSNYIMKIEEINIKMKPSIVYTFNLSGKDQIGGLWFVSQKDGFSKVELGMFCDVLNRYLNVNYSDRYVINNTYCTVVDVMKGNYINYQELEDGKVYEAFIPTIREIKSLM